MRKILIFLSILFIFLSSANVLLAGSKSTASKGEVRVVVRTEEKAKKAFAYGCKQVRKVKTLRALICLENVANSLALTNDIKVFASDLAANKQIKADLLQASGITGSGRKLAILDTGYNYNHPELSSSYLGGWDFVNNDNDPADDNGHGSHVAGIITADGINPTAKGVAPDVGILAGKVLAFDGTGYFSDVIAAIYWAVDGPDGVYGTSDDPSVDAINLSLGTSRPFTYKKFCDGVYPEMTEAIKYAREKSVLVVAAAGNNGISGVSLPGCISYATTVGAVDAKDRIASFSGRGQGVDITAPGIKIFSSWLEDTYLAADGTSMATPMVAATVALVKSVHPEYNQNQVEEAIFRTAKDLGISGRDTKFGWGRVDSFQAVNYTFP